LIFWLLTPTNNHRPTKPRCEICAPLLQTHQHPTPVGGAGAGARAGGEDVTDLESRRLDATGQTPRPSSDALLNSARQPGVNDVGGPAGHGRPGLGDVHRAGEAVNGCWSGHLARTAKAALTPGLSRYGILSIVGRLEWAAGAVVAF